MLQITRLDKVNGIYRRASLLRARACIVALLTVCLLFENKYWNGKG